MADAFDAPIAAREAASISDAAALMAKTRRIIGLFAKEANVRWPEFRWPADEGPIQAMLGGQFARHRRLLVVAGLQFQAYLFAGVVSIEGEAHAAVWVETRNKAIEPRRRVISAADALPLGPEWERDPGAWGGLHKSARLVSFPSHEAVAGWLLASMAELEAAGILAMIPTLGTAEAADVTDDDDQAGMTAN